MRYTAATEVMAGDELDDWLGAVDRGGRMVFVRATALLGPTHGSSDDGVGGSDHALSAGVKVYARVGADSVELDRLPARLSYLKVVDGQGFAKLRAPGAVATVYRCELVLRYDLLEWLTTRGHFASIPDVVEVEWGAGRQVKLEDLLVPAGAYWDAARRRDRAIGRAATNLHGYLLDVASEGAAKAFNDGRGVGADHAVAVQGPEQAGESDSLTSSARGGLSPRDAKIRALAAEHVSDRENWHGGKPSLTAIARAVALERAEAAKLRRTTVDDQGKVVTAEHEAGWAPETIRKALSRALLFRPWTQEELTRR